MARGGSRWASGGGGEGGRGAESVREGVTEREWVLGVAGSVKDTFGLRRIMVGIWGGGGGWRGEGKGGVECVILGAVTGFLSAVTCRHPNPTDPWTLACILQPILQQNS